MRVSREDICQEARRWIGTAFLHQGRTKKQLHCAGGCDCLGLLIGIASALDLCCRGIPIAQLDERSYGKVPSDNRLFESLSRHLYHVPSDQLLPSNILLFQVRKYPQHLGLLTSADPKSPTFIHACTTAGKVVEISYDARWRQHLYAVFSLYPS